MQYQVTCNKCGKSFLINGEGGKEMHCTCPYCSQELFVSLPIVAQPAQREAPLQGSMPTEQPIAKKQGSKASKVLLVVLIIIVALGAGSFAFLQWREHEELAIKELQESRKAHQDSLFRAREQQEAAKRAEQQKQEQQQRVCRFLADFYKKAVIPYGDPTFYTKYLTRYCQQLISSGEVANDGDAWQMWWGLFGMMNSSPNDEELIRNLRVTPINDTWYKVRLSEGGQTEFRHVKVVIDHGEVLIDDVR